MEPVQVWRGKYGDPIPPFGPLPGRLHENELVYEWALPAAFRPWPGRTQLERAYGLLDLGVSLADPLWSEVTFPDGRVAAGVGSADGDDHAWYVDLVHVDQTEDGYYVRDLFADVIVPSDGRHARLLDLDELADAVDDGLVPIGIATDGLRRWQRFFDEHLHADREAGHSWTDFPPARIKRLQELPEPLGEVVKWDF
jgi:hypothetical protein